MNKYAIGAAMLGFSALALAPTSSQAAVYSQSAATAVQITNAAPGQVELVQHWRGRPYWGYRAWGPRPYYGRIIAGVALGTLIGVAVAGVVPRRPAPDVCWYWVDRYRTQGYWDYC